MRLILFIPVLILFLSNVPFVQRIPVELAMEMMQQNETCAREGTCNRNAENLQSTCSSETEECEQSSGDEKTTCSNTDEKCNQTETDCVCICCFQYTAPCNSITEYQFNCSAGSISPSVFVQRNIKDPHLSAPWQPPDRC